jgi:hypothetical protein
MPPEIILIFICVVLVGVGVAVQRASSKMRKLAWRERNRGRWERNRSDGTTGFDQWFPKPETVPKQPDAADQLRIVMGADFTIQPLLNKREARVFRELNRIVISLNPERQVMAQVSVGEILRCQDAEAYRCINSAFGRWGVPTSTCRGYLSGGHYQGTAAARDAVKKRGVTSCRYRLS